jgi:hypothetical protein
LIFLPNWSLVRVPFYLQATFRTQKGLNGKGLTKEKTNKQKTKKKKKTLLEKVQLEGRTNSFARCSTSFRLGVSA